MCNNSTLIKLRWSISPASSQRSDRTTGEPITWSGSLSAGQTRSGWDFPLQHKNQNQRASKMETKGGGPGHQPSTTPHAVFLPRTRLALTWYSLSLPTTANGIASCGHKHVTWSRHMVLHAHWPRHALHGRRTLILSLSLLSSMSSSNSFWG